MPGSQCADENGIVLALAGKTNVVRECRRYVQVDPAACRLPAQEICFHLDIAVAEQQDVAPLAGGVEIIKAISGADRPIGLRSLLQVTPVPFKHFGGVAAML